MDSNVNSWQVERSQEPAYHGVSGSSTQLTSSDDSYKPTNSAGKPDSSRSSSKDDTLSSCTSSIDTAIAAAQPVPHEQQQPAKQAHRHQRCRYTIVAGNRRSELPPPQAAAKQSRLADAASPEAKKRSGGLLPGGIIPKRPLPPPPPWLPEHDPCLGAATPSPGSAGRRVDQAACRDIDDP